MVMVWSGLLRTRSPWLMSLVQVVSTTLDELIGRGQVMPFSESDSGLPSKWVAELGPDVHMPTLHLPFRHDDLGRFDYNPATAPVPVALWHHTASAEDRARLERLRKAEGIDWRTVRPFRAKEESGHERAWFAFLAGDDPDYPDLGLAAAQAQIRHRLRRMDQHRDREVDEADIHVWQQCNPVVAEAPGAVDVGRSTGALWRRAPAGPAALPRRRRTPPGLPVDVAALVTSIDPEATTVELVNPSPETEHTVIVQAGALTEHTIAAICHTACADDSWIGDLYDYGHTEPEVTEVDTAFDSPFVTVRLARFHPGGDDARTAAAQPHPQLPRPVRRVKHSAVGGARHSGRVWPPEGQFRRDQC